MKRFFLVFALVFYLILNPTTYAQLEASGGGVKVSVSVQNRYAQISGILTPYASIVLKSSNGIFIASTTADQDGRFKFKNVLLNGGVTDFCFSGIDQKRFGESNTCVSGIDEVLNKEVFLPPTLGLTRNIIYEGADALAIGYTMPRAKMTLSFDSGQSYTVVANDSGYYEVKIEKLRAGSYSLFAAAEYNSQESLRQSKGIQLKALSGVQAALDTTSSFVNETLQPFVSAIKNPIWIIIITIILSIILAVFIKRLKKKKNNSYRED